MEIIKTGNSLLATPTQGTLDPCPFCGGNNIAIGSNDMRLYMCICRDCLCTAGHVDGGLGMTPAHFENVILLDAMVSATINTVIDKWNTRTEANNESP